MFLKYVQSKSVKEAETIWELLFIEHIFHLCKNENNSRSKNIWIKQMLWSQYSSGIYATKMLPVLALSFAIMAHREAMPAWSAK